MLFKVTSQFNGSRKIHCKQFTDGIHRQQFTTGKFTATNNSSSWKINRQKFMQLVFRLVNCHGGELSCSEFSIGELLTMNMSYAQFNSYNHL